MKRALSVLAVLYLVALSGCATGGAFPAQVSIPPGPTASPAFSLYLIGDAGEAASPEPVLQGLKAAITADAAASAAVFLGDNVYPAGIPPVGHADRATMVGRLEAQINAVPGRAAAVFVPGNHDWAKGRREGLAAIQAAEEVIQNNTFRPATLAPSAGCPGPTVIDDLSPMLRLIALDTHWWLHDFNKGTNCSPNSEDEVVAALERALASAGARQVVLVAHHPMLSSGSHGYYFGWKAYLFPPYPLIRRLRGHDQDLGGGDYERLRTRLAAVMQKHRPLVYAGGHEHTQEVLRGDSARYFLVSGAGIHGHITATGTRPETLFKHAASGFMRLALFADGSAWLTVLEVDAAGLATPAFALRLE